MREVFLGIFEVGETPSEGNLADCVQRIIDSCGLNVKFLAAVSVNPTDVKLNHALVAKYPDIKVLACLGPLVRQHSFVHRNEFY